MEEIADGSEPEPDPTPEAALPTVPPLSNSARFAIALTLAWAILALPAPANADALDHIRATGRLDYGADEEGGAPYVFRDADDRLVGFEADLMAEIARELGAEPVFHQAQWENLLQVLGRGRIDVVINGYELTTDRVRDYLPTRPYYVYQLQLMALRGGSVRSWADFALPRPGGGAWKVGVLGMSAADVYARRFEGAGLEVVNFDGATTAMRAVRNGQIDATLQDLPAARHYIKTPEFIDHLALVGPPEASGYYVLYTRKEDTRLRDAIDGALGRLIDSGRIRAIDEKYDLWNDAQGVLKAPPVAGQPGPGRPLLDLDLLHRYGPSLVLAARKTVALACNSMPLAMILGLLVAIGRTYGPRPLAKALSVYVEVVRGTPLILQLYVLYYALPQLGIRLMPWAAAVAGLAINYSAYEAEIYRAGLQAIPKGQMEAALALGMSPAMAIRRVIVPQALRIVIPPVTGDFIALFKDTSICSVITLIELSKQYLILSSGHGGLVEFGLATAALYMAMSLPLSWLSRWVERRMDAGPVPGKGAIG